METTTQPSQTLSIIIPCYNEEEGIPQLERQLPPVLESLMAQWRLDVIFVDDGSKDATYALLQAAFGKLPYVRIIRHERNQNLGAAMRTGFAAAQGDVIVTMDSDCTYPPAEIMQMLALLDSQTDLVTASPYHPLGRVENVPGYRLVLSKSISWLYRLLTGAKIHTFTALFRVQRRAVVENVHFKSDNFLATAEMLIHAIFQGYHVKEFPTTLHVRQYGVSKMRLLKVIKSHGIFLLHLLPIAVRRRLTLGKK